MADRRRLTKNVVAGLTLERDGQWIGDTELPQLFVRQTPTAKTYVARWTSKTGARPQHTIGPCADMSVDVARDRARKLVTADKAPELSTLEEVYQIWDSTYSSKTSHDHAVAFRQAWHQHIKPHLGKVKLVNLNHAAVQRWYNVKLKEHPQKPNGGASDKPFAPATINRWVAYLSKLCSVARINGKFTGNPCEGLERSTPTRRLTVFTLEDLKEIADNLTSVELKYPKGVALLRFLMIFPCRGIEARQMEWADVDLRERQFTIPAARYKTRRDKTFPLGPLQVALLESLPKGPSKFVFPSPADPAKHVRKEYQRDVWHKVRNKPIGAHTLRKTIGTGLLNKGVPLEVVSKLLGHSSVTITEQVYAHLDPKTAAKYLELWTGLRIEDDLPEPTKDEKELEQMLLWQAARTIAEEDGDFWLTNPQA